MTEYEKDLVERINKLEGLLRGSLTAMEVLQDLVMGTLMARQMPGLHDLIKQTKEALCESETSKPRL